jgi:DNA-binding transcriptional ArsR family regulator
MHAFDVLGDPVRRRILELLNDSATATSPPGTSAGSISAIVQSEFGITQPAVSRHLRVLRENGFARVTIDGQRRLYAIDEAGLVAVDEWLNRYRRFW